MGVTRGVISFDKEAFARLHDKEWDGMDRGKGEITAFQTNAGTPPYQMKSHLVSLPLTRENLVPWEPAPESRRAVRRNRRLVQPDNDPWVPDTTPVS